VPALFASTAEFPVYTLRSDNEENLSFKNNTTYIKGPWGQQKYVTRILPEMNVYYTKQINTKTF